MTFAEALKKLREELNMTQEALARELNVSFATVNKWENNKTRPLRIVRDRIIDFGTSKGVSDEIMYTLRRML
ncbi:MAG TPA: transcriptional regulator [Ruminococcaceae bacterium]|nr:transcriptional regulator [Oscillospiraceae bacterium]